MNPPTTLHNPVVTTLTAIVPSWRTKAPDKIYIVCVFSIDFLSAELFTVMQNLNSVNHTISVSATAESNALSFSFYLLCPYAVGQLWNTLPSSIFPPYYDFCYFKCCVSRHLEENCEWCFTLQLLSLHFAYN